MTELPKIENISQPEATNEALAEVWICLDEASASAGQIVQAKGLETLFGPGTSLENLNAVDYFGPIFGNLRQLKKGDSFTMQLGKKTIRVHCINDKKKSPEGTLRGIRLTEVSEKKNEKAVLLAQIQYLSLIIKALGHDIRAGLNYIVMSASFLMEEDDLIKIRETLHQIVDSGFAINQIVQDLSSEQGERMPRTFDLQEIVSNILLSKKADADGKKIKLVSLVEKGLEGFADIRGINSAIRNLVGNALKFTYNGGNIEVDAKKEGRFLKVRVSDTGIGMTPEEKQKLFNPNMIFTKVGTASEPGHGLGFLLAKGFIEAEGGQIDLETEPGVGTTFFLTIPVAPEEKVGE